MKNNRNKGRPVEASSAAIALQMINAAIRVRKGTFKVEVTCLPGLVPCRCFLPSLLCFCLCTGKVKPSSESWSCNEVEVNDQFCFIKTRMSVADPGNVGRCFVAKLCASFPGNLPQQSQCERVATFDLLMRAPSKTAAVFQGKSRRNIWGQSSSSTAKQYDVGSYRPAAAGSVGHTTFKCRWIGPCSKA